MNGSPEHHFIEPLEAFYEVKAKTGVRVTLMQEMRGESEVALTCAAEHIKRTRKGQTFPSVAECLAALKVAAPAKALSVEDAEGKTYGARVAEFARLSGKDEFPVIQRWTDDSKTVEMQQWQAWKAYWMHIGAKTPLGITYSKDSYTFPTKWPQEFDATAPSWGVGDPDGDREVA